MNQPITVVEKNTLQRLVAVPYALQCTLGLTLNIIALYCGFQKNLFFWSAKWQKMLTKEFFGI